MIWGGWTATSIPDPKLAVDLFMMISGFLMSYNARLRESKEPMTRPISWLKFYVRRYFRIAPAYYVSLAIAALSAPIFLGGYKQLQLLNPAFWGTGGIYDPGTIRYTLDNLLAHLTFAFGALPKYTFATMLPDWSLSLEMQFYLMFPFAYLLFRKVGSLVGSSLLAASALLIAQAFATSFPEPGFLPLKMSLFLVGMLIAEIPFGTSRPVTIAIGALSLVLPFAQTSHYPTQYWMLPVLSGSFYLLTLTRTTQSGVAKVSRAILGGRQAHLLSEASYGIYLFHGFFISLTGYILFGGHALINTNGNGRTLILWALILPCSIFSALFLRNTVEKYGIDLGYTILAANKIDGSRAR